MDNRTGDEGSPSPSWHAWRGRGGSKGAEPQEGIPWPSSPGFGPGWRTGPIDHFDDLARGMTRKQGFPFLQGLIRTQYQ